MTARQRANNSRSPVRRLLGSSFRALRDLHDEQVYAWECLFRMPEVAAPYSGSRVVRQ
jgi:hypothetical protein